MAADIEVEITLESINGVQEAVPQLKNHNPMSVTKTVHYGTKIPNATVRIQFVQDPLQPQMVSLSPFDDSKGSEITSVLSSDPPSKLQRTGTFSCRCFVTLGNGTVIGWGPNNPNSGGNHVVRQN